LFLNRHSVPVYCLTIYKFECETAKISIDVTGIVQHRKLRVNLGAFCFVESKTPAQAKLGRGTLQSK